MDEDQINSEYIFFFVGGSGGSFAKSIFYYYLNKLTNRPPIIFEIDPVVGHCHNNNAIPHCHYIDQLDPAQKIVLIDFDDDDKPYIIKMAFHKVVKEQMANDPMFLEKQWGYQFSQIDKSNHKLVEQVLLENPDYLIFGDWREQVAQLTPALTIKFKDIMFGDVNSVISNFFQTERLLEVDNFVSEYRKANQKYLTSV